MWFPGVKTYILEPQLNKDGTRVVQTRPQTEPFIIISHNKPSEPFIETFSIDTELRGNRSPTFVYRIKMVKEPPPVLSVVERYQQIEVQLQIAKRCSVGKNVLFNAAS